MIRDGTVSITRLHYRGALDSLASLETGGREPFGTCGTYTPVYTASTEIFIKRNTNLVYEKMQLPY
jgi:hypothetical protein